MIFALSGGNNDIAKNHVGRALFDFLDLVFERDVGKRHLHNVRCKTIAQG